MLFMDRLSWRFSRFLKWAVLPLLLISAKCPPTPVVDVLASELKVKITVIDTEQAPSDGKVPVLVQFFHQGKYVELSGASIKCNGVTLSFQGLYYGERVPLKPAGGIYTLVHTRAGVNTTASIVVPSRPIITWPANGASVARSNSLTIHYVAGTGSGVRAYTGGSGSAPGGNLEPDSGTYTGLSAIGLNPGPGSISLVREFENIHSGGTGFSSVESSYSSGSQITVTWL